MPDFISPESRIFHIDSECYIVYLGNDLGDIRPFLRIGNSPVLTNEIHKEIATVVITDNHVGNPLLEILNVPKYQSRYLGDTNVVETMKRFFESFALPTDELTDYHRVKDGEKRHMVWFYSSGNINLRYDDKIVFDLHKREKQDKHFVRVFEEAKAEYYRNPFRYIKQDFSDVGLILADGNAFWYEAGEILSITAHQGFMHNLIDRGIDPDLIGSFISDLTYDDLDSPDAYTYICLLKRHRHRRNKLRVFTTDSELQRKFKLLFPVRGSTPSTLEIVDMADMQKGTFQGSIITRQKNGWRVRHAGLADVLFDGGIDEGLSVNVAKRTMRYRSGMVDVSFSIPDGYPIKFIVADIQEDQIINKYVNYMLTCIKDSLLPEEAENISALGNCLQAFRDGVKHSTVSPLLLKAIQNFRATLKQGNASLQGLSWFYFSNVSMILSMICRNLPAQHPLLKEGRSLGTLINSLIKSSPSPDSVLPFFGDLYLGENPGLLWQSVKRSVTSKDFANAKAINERINRVINLDEAPWGDNRERLLKLIRSLRGHEEGPLSSQQMALLYNSKEQEPSDPEEEPKEVKRPAPVSRPVEKKKSDKAPKPPVVKRPVEAKKTVAGPERTPSPILTPTAAQRKSRRPFNSLHLILLVLLPLFLAGGAIWDFTGKAPWGQVFRLKKSSSVEAKYDEVAEEGGASVYNPQDTEAEITNEGSAVAEMTEDGNTPDETGEVFSQDKQDKENVVTSSGVAEAIEGGNMSDETAKVSKQDADQKTNTETFSNAQTSNQGTFIDVNRIPKTLEEVNLYLDVNGRVTISEADIHLIANEIAVLNGYKDLDYRVFAGKDPDWIYPGNILMLPDTGKTIIRRGDTIWYLAVREIRLDAERGIREYDAAVDILNDSSSTREDRKISIDTLLAISRVSRVAELREIAAEMLKSRGL